MRVTKLGHTQRGGAPGVFDRMSATLLGVAAIEHVLAAHHGMLLGIVDGKVTPTPLSGAIHSQKPLDMRLVDLARILAE
jgi:6-phosphofructokinase 1